MLRGAAMEALRATRAAESAYWVEAGARDRLAALAGVEAELVVANDVSTAPLAFAIAGSAPVVLDLHEFAPLEHEDDLRWRMLAARQTDTLLRRLMPRAAAVTTVNEPIASAYERRYGRRPVVVTNAARMMDLQPSETADGRIGMAHHGVAMRGRQLEKMIDLLDHLDERFTLDMFLLGDDRYVAELRERATAQGRVKVHPALPMEEIVQTLNAFDVGLYILAPSGFNNLNALPNKFFDFVQARLAIAIGPSPAMADLVSRHGLGVVADSFAPHALAERLQHLDAERIHRFKQAAHVASTDLCAERNAEILREVIAGALSDAARGGTAAPQPTRP